MGRRKIEIDLKEVERLASIGLNEQQIADSLGIHTDTLQDRKDNNPDFSEALKRGKASGIATVCNNLFEQSANGSVPAGIFFLKNRAGWRDSPPEDIETEAPALNITFETREAVSDIKVTNAKFERPPGDISKQSKH